MEHFDSLLKDCSCPPEVFYRTAFIPKGSLLERHIIVSKFCYASFASKNYSGEETL